MLLCIAGEVAVDAVLGVFVWSVHSAGGVGRFVGCGVSCGWRLPVVSGEEVGAFIMDVVLFCSVARSYSGLISLYGSTMFHCCTSVLRLCKVTVREYSGFRPMCTVLVVHMESPCLVCMLGVRKMIGFCHCGEYPSCAYELWMIALRGCMFVWLCRSGQLADRGSYCHPLVCPRLVQLAMRRAPR